MKGWPARLASKIFIVFYKIIFGNRVSFGKNVLIFHKFRFAGPGKLYIGDNCNLWANEEWNRFYTYSPEAEIRIGEGSRINGLTVHCREKVEIGRDSVTGSAIILDNDVHEMKNPKNILYGPVKSKPVVVGDNCWLCGQSALLKGTRVGDNSVVGFRAVVSGEFPTDCVIAGNPAKVLKTKG